MEVLKKIKNWFSALQKNNPKKLLIITIISLIIASVIGWLVIYLVIQRQNASIDSPAIHGTLPAVNSSAPQANLAILPRRLDGMMVASADADKWPVAVMIENAAFSGVRPQSGLSRALGVYEIIVEGGITRFMAVFGGENTPAIGPVRSARDTYLEFASELRAVYGHAGGSFSALQALRDIKEVTNLEALSGDGKYFWRDRSTAAPHNLYTSSTYLTYMLRDKGLLDKPAEFSAWQFKDEDPLDSRPLADDSELIDYIKIDFSGASYIVEWKYQREQNYYERWNGGELQRDKNNQEAITAKNVIIEQVLEGWYIEGKGRINFSVTDEGKAVIFNNGRKIEGTWKKSDRASRTVYYDSNGAEVEFVRGNYWVEIVPVDRPYEFN